MNNTQNSQISNTINSLLLDSKNDRFKIMKSFAKSMFRAIEPKDFEDVYLSISQKQGVALAQLVKENQLNNIVEFGTSFGISTLYMAQGLDPNLGKIISTELMPSKAKKALENFEKAGVSNLIEVRVGDAMETLANYNAPIDLLFLDGWKDLYLPLFEMLSPNFHKNTIIYVDNADMADAHIFMQAISQNTEYQLKEIHGGKAALITLN